MKIILTVEKNNRIVNTKNGRWLIQDLLLKYKQNLIKNKSIGFKKVANQLDKLIENITVRSRNNQFIITIFTNYDLLFPNGTKKEILNFISSLRKINKTNKQLEEKWNNPETQIWSDLIYNTKEDALKSFEIVQ